MSPHPNSKKARAAVARRAQARADRDETKRLTKQEARLARQLDERRKSQRRTRMRRVRNITAGVVVGAVAIGGVWYVVRPDPELAGVTRPSDRGGGHTTGAAYESATPTSGAHDSRATACGTYRDPLEPSLAVHALEHGAVVLWYDASRPELADELAAATEKWDSHVLISANTSLQEPIVATAWNRLKAYQPGDPELTDFVGTYRRRGPEQVPCDR